MISITDPEIQARLQADYARGIVPVWNANDADQAQAFVDYYNNLVGINVVSLVPITNYKFEVRNPSEEELNNRKR